MANIREIVQQALQNGYLSVADEDRLRQLLRGRYDVKDINAFNCLQDAVMAGQVRQESWEQLEQKT